MNITFTRIVPIIIALLTVAPAQAHREFSPAEAYQDLRESAEQYYKQGSYKRAHELYVEADVLELNASRQRWVDFRLADTKWRAQAATETSDPTIYNEAKEELAALARRIDRIDERDRVWAEVHESLGDFYWQRSDGRNWSNAWPHYEKALQWWAGQSNIELARRRYIDIVWTIVDEIRFSYYFRHHVPLDILENVSRIAESEKDRSRAHYLVARKLAHTGGIARSQQVIEHYKNALKAGPDVDWYDDALYRYAKWMQRNGRVDVVDGSWRSSPDYAKALELYSRLTSEFSEQSSQYYDNAKDEIEDITGEELNVSVSDFFLPASEVEYHIAWRNLETIELRLYKINFVDDITSEHWQDGRRNWLDHVNLEPAKKLRTWSKDVIETTQYTPAKETIRLPDPPGIGAYVLAASSGDVTSRELILVTDITVVAKHVGETVLTYVCNAIDGSPVSGAKIQSFDIERVNRDKQNVRTHTAETNDDGIAILKNRSTDGDMYFITAAKGSQQAMAVLNRWWGHHDRDGEMKVYVFTDRPAYRPEDTVHWKLIARERTQSGYITPADRTIKYTISDPHDSEVDEGTVILNDYGSGWGEFVLSSDIPLGEYTIQFSDRQSNKHLGSATLFQLEEYKLPEYEVTIETPTEHGERKVFRTGDTVSVDIKAEYYFGGPVTNAAVEIKVYQQQFHHWWRPQRQFGWFYDDDNPYRYRHRGSGKIIKETTLQTDETGLATLTFDTPADLQHDFEYTVEANVTDASRREVTARENIRVTRQKYFVHLQPEHNIHRPGDSVTVDLKTIDANDNPVAAEGTVTVVRRQWVQKWITPRDETRVINFAQGDTLPADHDNWRLIRQGYIDKKVTARSIETNQDGVAAFSFQTPGQGYYQITWHSDTQSLWPIREQTYVWVTDKQTSHLGYHADGVNIVVDKETFKAGQTAPVMITTETSGRHVLFTIEGNDLYHHDIVKLDGTAKLIEIDIQESYIPNVSLNATMVSETELHADAEEVVIPPVEHFLTVEVEPARQHYQPRDEGMLRITTRNYEGEPVSAEIALAVFDESVTSIAEEQAGDPKRFFYGDRQHDHVRTESMFELKSLVKLTKDAEQEISVKTQEGAAYVPGILDRENLGTSNRAPASSLRSGGGADGGIFGDPGEARAGRDLDMAFESRRRVAMEPPPPPPAASKASADSNGEPEEETVVVRSDFRATAFWQPAVITDDNGEATVTVAYPDSLTTWNAVARAATTQSRFGMGEATTLTRKPLIVRLQAPRFFTVGDETTVSAVINNNTEEPFKVTPEIDIDGLAVTGYRVAGKAESGEPGPVEVAPNTETRIDWLVHAKEPGEATITIAGRDGGHADAMEKSYPVYAHGIERLLVESGKARADEVTVKLDLPEKRRAETTELTVQVTPSLAVTMLDALPYLIDYPYGCTEQTMSRFLPAVVVADTLRELDIDPDTAMNRVFGGIEEQFAEKTHPDGARGLDELDKVIKQGLNRLYDFQHSDGGWGWWKHGDSDHFMTAYIVWGLSLAEQAGVNVRDEVLAQGASYLDKNLIEAEFRADLQTWMLHASAAYHTSVKGDGYRKPQRRALENIWQNRDELNACSRALLALAAKQFGDDEKAMILIENLENGIKIDRTPDTSVIVRGEQSHDDATIATAHWGEDGVYRRWSDGGVEATAFALQAMLAIKPDHELVEPVLNWLIKNRRGGQWSNTRDTSIVLLALTEYLKQSSELSREIAFDVLVNGEKVTSTTLTPEEIIAAPARISVDRDLIRDGVNDIRIVRTKGDGPLYFSAQAAFFSLEEPIPASGNEIFVRRDYQKLVSRPTLLKGFVYDRVPLSDGDRVESGDRVEVVITVEAKNNYEYLVFEDLKPAGLEAVQIQSGEPIYARELRSGVVDRRFEDREPVIEVDSAIASGPERADFTGQAQRIHQELRDRKVALFLSDLNEGVWEIRYTLRAEVPGQFHGLPVLGHAMYVPEIRCNSAETRLTVYDQK